MNPNCEMAGAQERKLKVIMLYGTVGKVGYKDTFIVLSRVEIVINTVETANIG